MLERMNALSITFFLDSHIEYLAPKCSCSARSKHWNYIVFNKIIRKHVNLNKLKKSQEWTTSEFRAKQSDL